MIINSGQLSTGEVIIYNGIVMQGLENALSTINDVVAEKIALTRPVNVGAQDGNPLSKHIPSDMFFPFAPPTARPEDLTSTDRSFNPMVRNTVKISVKPYGAGYDIQRKDFYNDIYHTLGNVPKLLARAMMKLPDILLAGLLRNGKTTLDYTGTFAFSTTKPKSVNGAISGTYSNLYTSSPLTAINLGQVVADMMSRVNEDGLNLGLMPDTLIVPPTLYPAAVMACEMKNAVFSGTAGTGNLWPGQANNTAAVGDNWVAHTGLIKQIVVLPELLDGGASIDTTTWYVAECMNPAHGGPCGLLAAMEPGFEFLTNLNPSDPQVFYKNKFAWATERYAGVGYGVTSYLSRAEA